MTFIIALPEVGLQHTTVANQRAREGNSTSKMRGSLTDNSCEMSTDNLSTIGNLLMLASVKASLNNEHLTYISKNCIKLCPEAPCIIAKQYMLTVSC